MTRNSIIAPPLRQRHRISHLPVIFLNRGRGCNYRRLSSTVFSSPGKDITLGTGQRQRGQRQSRKSYSKSRINTERVFLVSKKWLNFFWGGECCPLWRFRAGSKKFGALKQATTSETGLPVTWIRLGNDSFTTERHVEWIYTASAKPVKGLTWTAVLPGLLVRDFHVSTGLLHNDWHVSAIYKVDV